MSARPEVPSRTDVVIVGAGPAGIFCALALVKNARARSVVMVEQGLPVEERFCPKSRSGGCVGCDPCRITTGFSGAGAFSDGKLSLSYEVGGDLPELIGEAGTQEAIDRVDAMYLAFGADGHVEGIGNEEARKDIRRRAIAAGLKLVDCPIRHLGTECAQQIYRRIEQALRDAGVVMLFKTVCREVLVEDGRARGVVVEDVSGVRSVISAGDVVVDTGVRVEVRNEVMETVNNVLYESKLIGYPKPYRNKVRTFCQNPGGFVSQEMYDGGLAVVNGHSYKMRKSDNTNLAVLVTQNFREPFDQPIAYAQKVGELTNMLGAGHILVQRFGDILEGGRTWPKELKRSNVQPTLPDAEAGDITAAMPYRAMTNIINFMLAVDEVVPGFAAEETLLYSPELKFYSNRVRMDGEFRTNVQGLTCLGDSSGWTRGLMMASLMGLLAGERLAAEGGR